MNAYDFDKTIYYGDSTVDFYKFCIRKDPTLLRYIFSQGTGFFLYILGVYNKTKFKESFYSFLRGIQEPSRYVKAFWDLHICRIKPWYIKQMRRDDVIISASPAFLVSEAMQRLGTATIIASDVDIYTGRYNGVNCYGSEKVRRFYEIYPNGVVEAFYSDSNSDAPMGRVAQDSYIVKGDEVCLINWQ